MPNGTDNETGGVLAFLKKILFVDLLKGLTLTFRYNVSRTVTMRYPDEEKWIPYERFRGLHTLNKDEQGRELCVACELCSRACPTDCITVVPMEDTTGRGITDRVAKVWKVDLVRCLFCGYCEEACPTTAVRMGRDYELACFDISRTKREREELLMGQEFPEDHPGGVVVRAKFDRGDGERVRVVADMSSKQLDWWKQKKLT